jgi:hypothetical protein
MQTTATIADLKPGMRFKWERTQRTYRRVMNTVELGHGDNIPTPYKGMTLVVMEHCRQLTAKPDAVVFLDPTKNS